MPYPAERSLARIREQLARMRAVVQSPQLLITAEKVSGWSPAEHLDHTIKVAVSVVKRLTRPEATGTTISLAGRAVLFFNWIPRGRGRSPARLSGARETPEALEIALSRFDELVQSISASEMDNAPVPTVPHPRFGGLTAQQALRFVGIHTEHHLRIIDDILRAHSR